MPSYLSPHLSNLSANPAISLSEVFLTLTCFPQHAFVIFFHLDVRTYLLPGLLPCSGPLHFFPSHHGRGILEDLQCKPSHSCA